jgi:hypothetical protein
VQYIRIGYLEKYTNKEYFIGIIELNQTITIAAYEPNTAITVEGTYRNANEHIWETTTIHD